MPNFEFEAMDWNGKQVEGTVEADTQAHAVVEIRANSLFPTRVTQIADPRTERSFYKESPKPPAGCGIDWDEFYRKRTMRSQSATPNPSTIGGWLPWGWLVAGAALIGFVVWLPDHQKRTAEVARVEQQTGGQGQQGVEREKQEQEAARALKPVVDYYAQLRMAIKGQWDGPSLTAGDAAATAQRVKTQAAEVDATFGKKEGLSEPVAVILKPLNDAANMMAAKRHFDEQGQFIQMAGGSESIFSMFPCTKSAVVSGNPDASGDVTVDSRKASALLAKEVDAMFGKAIDAYNRLAGSPLQQAAASRNNPQSMRPTPTVPSQPDPVVLLKTHADTLRRNIDRLQTLNGSVVSSSIDVRKTDSLISPLMGLVDVVRQKGVFQFEDRYTLAFQDGGWVLKGKEGRVQVQSDGGRWSGWGSWKPFESLSNYAGSNFSKGDEDALGLGN